MTNSMKANLTLVSRIAMERYGAGICTFDPTFLLWASDKALEKSDAETVKKELKLINRVRSKRGLIPAVHAYGHPLF